MSRLATRTALLIMVVLFSVVPLGAATHRAAVPGPAPAVPPGDPFSVGISGSSVSGTVASVQGSIITLNSGGAPAIRIDATAAKFLGDGGSLTITDAKPGARITAFINTATTIAAGAPLPAQLIAIEAAPDLVVTGPLQSIDAAHSKFTVLGIGFTVDSGTAFSSAFPTFAAIKGLGDLAVGQVVNVTASFTSGNIVAKRIQLLAPVIPATTVIRGKVKSISATAWVITNGDGKDITVTVDAQTKITGSPKVGDSVSVLATIDSAHNYIAVVIAKLDQGGGSEGEHVELRGYVKSIAPAQWTIGGPQGSLTPDFTVLIASTTVIYSNPAVGDHVVVSGTRNANGVLVAVKIAKSE